MAAKTITVTRLDFENMQRMRQQINRAKLEHIRFYDGDKRVRISKEKINEWKFTGLNNVDFIAMVLLGTGWHL